MTKKKVVKSFAIITIVLAIFSIAFMAMGQEAVYNSYATLNLETGGIEYDQPPVYSPTQLESNTKALSLTCDDVYDSRVDGLITYSMFDSRENDVILYTSNLYTECRSEGRHCIQALKKVEGNTFSLKFACDMPIDCYQCNTNTGNVVIEEGYTNTGISSLIYLFASGQPTLEIDVTCPSGFGPTEITNEQCEQDIVCYDCECINGDSTLITQVFGNQCEGDFKENMPNCDSWLNELLCI